MSLEVLDRPAEAAEQPASREAPCRQETPIEATRPARFVRLAVLWPRWTPCTELALLTLLVDQTRRFTGSQSWLSPWLALPLAAILALLLGLAPRCAPRFSAWSWALMLAAAVAIYWPLNGWALAISGGALLAALLLSVAPGAASLSDRLPLPRLTVTRTAGLVWGAYLWCLVVHPHPWITMLATALLPLPAAVVLSRWIFPAGPARWASAALLLLLVPALPWSVTGGAGLPIGFYSLLIWVLLADVLAVVAALRARRSSRAEGPWHIGAEGLSVGLVTALAAAVRLAPLVARAIPVGGDQFQYYDFARTIVATGSTLAPRPFYMLGEPAFLTAPLTAVYLAFLGQLSGQPLFPFGAIVLVGAGMLQTLAVVALARACRLGGRTALVAGLLWALLPVTLDMQSWFGLANAVALSELALLLVAVVRLWRRPRGRGIAAATVLAASLALTHPLSAIFAAASAVLLVGALLCRNLLRRGPWPWSSLAALAISGLAAAALSAHDLYVRYLAHARFVAGTWADYLASRPDAVYTGLMLGVAVGVLGGAAFLLMLPRTASGHVAAAPVLALSLASGVILIGWAWGLRFFYGRALIFLALGLVPLAAWLIDRLAGYHLPRALALAVLTLAPAAGSITKSSQDFFRYPDQASIQAFQWIRDHTPPADVMAVQTCQFSAASYLSQRPVIPAMLPTQLASGSEYPATQAALSIFQGSPGFEQALAAYGVKTVVLDRGCLEAGAVQRESQLRHLFDLPDPFRPAFDNGEVLVLRRAAA